MGAHGGSGGRAHGWIVWAAASAACLLLAVLAVVSLSRQAGREDAKPSAEIYFSNSSSIATWTNSRSLSFSFIIHNLSKEANGYRYDIYMTGKGNKNILIADKVLTLGPQQRTTISETLKPPKQGRFQVSVSLHGSASTIFFWTQAPSPHRAGSQH